MALNFLIPMGKILTESKLLKTRVDTVALCGVRPDDIEECSCFKQFGY